MKKLVGIAILLCHIAIFAQEDLEVTVMNFNTNKPITNISVTLFNKNRAYEVTKTSSSQGRVYFNSIPVVNASF